MSFMTSSTCAATVASRSACCSRTLRGAIRRRTFSSGRSSPGCMRVSSVRRCAMSVTPQARRASGQTRRSNTSTAWISREYRECNGAGASSTRHPHNPPMRSQPTRPWALRHALRWICTTRRESGRDATSARRSRSSRARMPAPSPTLFTRIGKRSARRPFTCGADWLSTMTLLRPQPERLRVGSGASRSGLACRRSTANAARRPLTNFAPCFRRRKFRSCHRYRQRPPE